MRIAVARGIESEETFIQKKLEVLKSVSRSTLICTSFNSREYGTSHTVVYRGYVTTVSAAHFACGGVVPANMLACEGVDISLRMGCPNSSTALDISDVAELRDADLAMSYGFPSSGSPEGTPVARSWVGRFTGNHGVNKSGHHFTGGENKNVYQVADAYVITASQLGVASGASVLNGCGYLGIAHMSTSGNVQCFVTPWKYVHRCINEHSKKLMKIVIVQIQRHPRVTMSPSRSCARAQVSIS
jgi:hypothetical protein